jgi:hypothetical protein
MRILGTEIKEGKMSKSNCYQEKKNSRGRDIGDFKVCKNINSFAKQEINKRLGITWASFSSCDLLIGWLIINNKAIKH